MGQARIVMRGGRGAGGRLGERTGSAWCRADNGRGGRGAGGARGDYLEGREKPTNRGWGRGAWGLGNLSLVLGCVHIPFLRKGVDRGGV